MVKEVRLLCLFLGLLVVASNGCRHKPAYSEIDANKTSTRNRNSEGTAGSVPAPATADLPSSASTPAAGASPPGVKPASFLNQAGGIKDLPNYPRSRRTNVQMGPNQGFYVFTEIFESGDSVEQIAAFYEKAIKDNQWSVLEKVVDPELAQFALEKGKENTAKLQIKKEQRTGRIYITVERSEKMAEAGK